MTRRIVTPEPCERLACDSRASPIMRLLRDTPPPQQHVGAPHGGCRRLPPVANRPRLADCPDSGALSSDSRKAPVSGAAATEPGRAFHVCARRPPLASARARDSAVLRRRASRFCAHRGGSQFVAQCVAQHRGPRRAAARSGYFLGATYRSRSVKATQNTTQSPAVSRNPRCRATSRPIVVGAPFIIRIAR
jgi:hypothetical protein